MASHPARPQLGLFDNSVRVFSLDELAETVRRLGRERPGRTVEELSGAVFTELAIKRTQRAADLVAEAIRLARPRQPGTEITGSQWQASTSEVRNWAQRRLRTRRRRYHPLPGHHRVQPGTSRLSLLN
jgi:hypothetical protein